MKPIDVTSSTYRVFGIKNNDKDPKFTIGHHVKMSKFKNVFAKVYFQIGLKKFLSLKRVKNTVSWTYIISDLKCE